MGDVMPVVLVVVIVAALADLVVTATLLLVRWRRRRTREVRPPVRPIGCGRVAGTLLFTVPERSDVDLVLGALARAGVGGVIDPDDERVLLVPEPWRVEDREQVRQLLARESVPGRFTEE